MRRLFFLCMSFVLFFGCGSRKEKEKEVVYNDPRVQDQVCPVNSDCICQCNPRNCGQCPRGYRIDIVNTNSNSNVCSQQQDDSSPKCPAVKPDKTPIIIVNQEQNQDQTSTNQNDINNDNSRVNKTVTAIINNRKYICYKKYCGNHNMSCGSSPQTTLPEGRDFKELNFEGEDLDCYSDL